MIKSKRMVMSSLAVFCILIFSSTAMAECLSFDVSDKAELTKVGMYLKKIRKKSTEKAVVFEVTLKNTDSAPQLYSITVFIPGVGGSEGFIPAKGDKKLASKAEGKTNIGIISAEFPNAGYGIQVKAVDAR